MYHLPSSNSSGDVSPYWLTPMFVCDLILSHCCCFSTLCIWKSQHCSCILQFLKQISFIVQKAKDSISNPPSTVDMSTLEDLMIENALASVEGQAAQTPTGPTISVESPRLLLSSPGVLENLHHSAVVQTPRSATSVFMPSKVFQNKSLLVFYLD